MYDLLLENTWQLDWHHWEGTGVGAFLNWSSAPIALHRGSPRQRLTSEFANLAHRGTYCAQSMAFWVMNSNRISSRFQSQPASMVLCVPTWWLTWLLDWEISQWHAWRASACDGTPCTPQPSSRSRITLLATLYAALPTWSLCCLLDIHGGCLESHSHNGIIFLQAVSEDIIQPVIFLCSICQASALQQASDRTIYSFNNGLFKDRLW